MRRFDHFRLSLRQREQPDLFEEREITREEWLRDLFSRSVEFRHRGSDFAYVPAPDQSDEKTIVGRVGRNVLRSENMPPDRNLEEFMRESWQAAVIVVDPTHHEDGQKVAAESRVEVGKPSALLQRLITALEEASDTSPYFIEVHPIFPMESFWEFVEKNRGKIKSVGFEFAVPNMFGGADEFLDEMRRFRDS